jgi:hypothetical protein
MVIPIHVWSGVFCAGVERAVVVNSLVGRVPLVLPVAGTLAKTIAVQTIPRNIPRNKNLGRKVHS